MRDEERAARELASKTAGSISRTLARRVGFEGAMVTRRLKSETWSAPTPRVLLLTGAPETFERDAWIALHDAGPNAAIDADTALALWRVPGFSRWPIHVGHDRGRRVAELEGVVQYESRLWPAHHRLLLSDMPIVTPTRALFDHVNGDDVNPHRAERAINNAWARGLTSGELLQQMADEWCERGRRGSAFLHEYLSTRPIDWEPPASNLEGRFVDLIVKAGMPEPKRQRNLGDDVSWIGRVDMQDPEAPVIAEIQSDLFHTAPLDVAADAVRIERLRAAGFVVEEFREAEVWYQPDVVVDRWRAARQSARSLKR